MSTEPQPKKQKRFTAQRKQEIVLRLLKGEPIELLSRELSVPTATLSEWRETFLTSAFNGLKSKPKDDRDERIKELERKVGQITMDNELLYAKIEVSVQKYPSLTKKRAHDGLLTVEKRSQEADSWGSWDKNEGSAPGWGR